MRDFIQTSRASIDKNDLELLFNLLGDFHPKNILEIGTWKGFSAEVWIRGFAPENFITIEIEKEKIKEYDVNSRPGYQSWYDCDSHDTDTYDIVKIYLPEIDFLFIDGDHSYDGVVTDWKLYSPLVKKGGVVVFHDVVYTSPDPLAPVEVRQFWQEIRGKYTWVEIHSTNSTGMGVLWV